MAARGCSPPWTVFSFGVNTIATPEETYSRTIPLIARGRTVRECLQARLPVGTWWIHISARGTRGKGVAQVFGEFVEGAIEIGEALIPVEFAGRMVQAMLAVPVPSKKESLRANQDALDKAMDRGDRKEFVRLSLQRDWIKKEWGRG